MRNAFRIFLLCVLCASAVNSFAAEVDDKDLTILRLQKIIAEQSLAQLLENERVKEYARIRASYERVIAEIAAAEKKNADKGKIDKEKGRSGDKENYDEKK